MCLFESSATLKGFVELKILKTPGPIKIESGWVDKAKIRIFWGWDFVVLFCLFVFFVFSYMFAPPPKKNHGFCDFF